ncbi:MAG: tRNA lysidine(34) synthetase TilS [Planctomycetota bacterium]|nr:tRNA lysidine(34) synthetase TilS [Planctomycetota bacterium]
MAPLPPRRLGPPQIVRHSDSQSQPGDLRPDAPQDDVGHSSLRIDPWSARWSRLAHSLDLLPSTPVAVALSGGADSVFLLHLLARSRPRPKLLAIHVDHGLRGEESRLDAEFCARLCARLEVPFARRVVELDPESNDLERRAREARYRALADEASAAGLQVLLTGHHEDDAVETLLMRWMRGTELSGLAGLRRETVLGRAHARPEADGPLRVLRPLIALRREEVRSALRAEGLEWREDSSNSTDRFTRGRVRHQVIPEIEAHCGVDGVDNFVEFARAVESFEDELADRTAHLQWEPVAHEPARRSSDMPDLGGRISREHLESLSTPLVRRALGRLIGEGTGQRPSKEVLQGLADDLGSQRNGRRELHQGWSVQLQSDAVHLTPPASLLAGDGAVATLSPPAAPAAPATSAPPSAQRTQPALEEDAPDSPSAVGTISSEGLVLGLPGSVRLPDGRSIVAAFAPTSAPVPTSATVVDIDAGGIDRLRVRFERPGDRFRGLGSPGHKPLRRFLSDLGIPREERGLVPVVTHGEEIVWVAGIRPAESRRVGPTTTRRLRLTLEGARGS